MADRTPCDPETIRQLELGRITTNPTTGQVFRLGREAKSAQSCGYTQVHIGKGRRALAHRIVWIDANGPIPNGLEINHMNQNRTDNRLCNLELVTHAQNLAHARGTNGYNGAGVRPVDLEAMADLDPEWLKEVLALAATGNATTDQIGAIRRAAPPTIPLYDRGKSTV